MEWAVFLQPWSPHGATGPVLSMKNPWHSFTSEMLTFIIWPIIQHSHPLSSLVVFLSLGILWECMRIQTTAKSFLSVLLRAGDVHLGGHVLPGWRPSKVISRVGFGAVRIRPTPSQNAFKVGTEDMFVLNCPVPLRHSFSHLIQFKGSLIVLQQQNDRKSRSLTMLVLLATLTFDLLTLKCIHFIFVPKCAKVPNLEKFSQSVYKISCAQTFWGCTHRPTEPQTTLKHSASNAVTMMSET